MCVFVCVSDHWVGVVHKSGETGVPLLIPAIPPGHPRAGAQERPKAPVPATSGGEVGAALRKERLVLGHLLWGAPGDPSLDQRVRTRVGPGPPPTPTPLTSQGWLPPAQVSARRLLACRSHLARGRSPRPVLRREP